MAANNSEDQTNDSDELTTGLYPAKTEKVVEPIKVSVKTSKAKTKAAPTVKPVKVKSALAIEDEDKSEKLEKSDLPESQEQTTDLAANEPKETPIVAKSSETKELDEDDNAAQVPDTEAATKSEFIDEGQYHITVPKKGKVNKSSGLSKLLWVIFIIFLLVIAVYLYADVFGINLNDIVEAIQGMIG